MIAGEIERERERERKRGMSITNSSNCCWYPQLGTQYWFLYNHKTTQIIYGAALYSILGQYTVIWLDLLLVENINIISHLSHLWFISENFLHFSFDLETIFSDSEGSEVLLSGWTQAPRSVLRSSVSLSSGQSQSQSSGASDSPTVDTL